MSESNDDHTLASLHEVHEFVVRCITACHVCREHAEDLATLLVAADYRGHYSHGLNNLYSYVNQLDLKIVATEGSPQVLKETMATALVDGHHLLGPVIGKFCMDMAIEKARTAGIGWVVARASTHFGIAGWYGSRATEQGMLGMAFTNASPWMPPTRSIEPVLGTNPICVSAPAENGDSFLLDMATSTVAHGKVAVAQRKNEEIPVGWGMDEHGRSVTDPSKVKLLCPLGGDEKTSGYKGYGLSMMVDILTGVLGGGKYGPYTEERWESDQRPELGQCFVAINPDVFADGFTERMSDLMNYCRGLEPIAGAESVMVAGDPERQHMAKVDKQGGVYYHNNLIQSVNDLANRLNVEPLKTFTT